MGEQLTHPGTLLEWVQRVDSTTILGLAQSLGHFMGRHLFIVLFTILALFFLLRAGASLGRGMRAVLRDHIGARADAYVRLATRAVRASVNGMLVVALFGGFATGVAYAIVGVPNPAVWGAITGALALVPFLVTSPRRFGLQLAVAGAVTSRIHRLGAGAAVSSSATR